MRLSTATLTLQPNYSRKSGFPFQGQQELGQYSATYTSPLCNCPREASKLTLTLLTTTIVAPPSNASKWQMGFNSAFRGLKVRVF